MLIVDYHMLWATKCSLSDAMGPVRDLVLRRGMFRIRIRNKSHKIRHTFNRCSNNEGQR